MKFRASVIISFYNKIEWLKLVLAALQQQSVQDFEILIADDGSKEEIVKQIETLKLQLPLSIKHIWHADAGFRKTIILNKAIVASASDYLIFIDGDCVPHKNFVEDHIRLQHPNQVLAGRRVYLSDELSKSLTVANIEKGKLEKFSWSRLVFNKLVRHSEKAIHCNFSFVNKKLGSYKKGLLGCNFSVSKELMLKVNGFDERYQFPGVGEDSEIEYRWLLGGAKIFAPRFALVQFHLWHPLLSREQKLNNLQLFNETKEKGYIQTPYGIHQ